MKAAGLIFDNSPHYLDHLGPFCALKGWPLILCDPDLADIARHFYPDLQIIEQDVLELKDLLKKQTIVSCTPRLEALLNIPIFNTLWLPHGNSDKGQIKPWFDALKEEKTLLVYGQKMIDFLKLGSIHAKMIPVGDFRKKYFEKHKSFYENLGLPIQFAQKQTTILYAPTWEDSENNCSLWQSLPKLAQGLPDALNLIVKPHPNTLAKQAPALERLIGQYERKNLQFLLNYPPIFPLLEQCDIYLGDRSSIGYDFLLLDRPLFFLDPHTDRLDGKDLQSCGTTVTPDTFYEALKKEEPAHFSEKRKMMSAHVFNSKRNICSSSRWFFT